MLVAHYRRLDNDCNIKQMALRDTTNLKDLEQILVNRICDDANIFWGFGAYSISVRLG